jgi:hypothetical protein
MAYIDARDWFYAGLSRILPARLVYWVHVRVSAHGSTGKYSGQILPDMTVVEAIDRWSNDHNL